MSTAIATTEERPLTLDDDSGLILTSGPVEQNGSHAYRDWFGQLRFDAWKTFQETALPVRTDEAWRFATIKALDLSGYSRAMPVEESVAAELIRRAAGGFETAGRMIFCQ